MSNKKELRIVRGNDFTLKIPVSNIIFLRDENGYQTIGSAPVSLGACDNLKVNVNGDCGDTTQTISKIDKSILYVKVGGSLECGWYGLELTYSYEGVKYRSYERKVFKIVENNGRSYVNPDMYEGELSYQIDTMWSLQCIVDEVDLHSLIARTQSYERGNGKNSTQLIGSGSAAEGECSHAEGCETIAGGFAAHAEGYNTKANGENSHAEGEICKAEGYCSHAEGWVTEASGHSSHSEGSTTVASGGCSHAEGDTTEAIGSSSHAEGSWSKAVGDCSHAEGSNTIANNDAEHASGKYNISREGKLQSERTLFTVGNGTSAVRSNATEVRENGDLYIWFNGVYQCLQNMFADIEEIRAGAAKGATALQMSDIDSTLSEDSEKPLQNRVISEYIDSVLSFVNSNYSAINTLRQDFDSLVSGDTSTAIKDFNDIVAFLEGIRDNENLDSIIGSIEQQIAEVGRNSSMTYEIMDIGNLYKDNVNANYYRISSVVYNMLSEIWEKNTLPILKVTLNNDTTSLSFIVIKHNSEFIGFAHKQGDNLYHWYVNINSSGGRIYTHQEQEKLVSGVNIKTINGESILGDGDINLVEGEGCKETGTYSHAEGYMTTADGNYSHAEGFGTIAFNEAEHACGKYNSSSTGVNASDRTIFSVGNGAPPLPNNVNQRSNAIEVRENGDVYIWLNGTYVCLQEVLNNIGNTYATTASEEELENLVDSYLEQ